MLRTSTYASSVLAAALLAVPVVAQKADSLADQQLAAFYSGNAWRAFLDEVGGDWRVQWCKATGSPRSIVGSGIALGDWRENTLEEARRHAVQLLQQRGALLGLGTSEFREVIGARMGRTWSFVFDQFYRGLPVIGGRADVRVHMVGRVPMFGSTAWNIPADFSITPALGEEVANAIAWQKLGQSPTGAPQPAVTPAPRLVIWGDAAAEAASTPTLAWEVAISNVAADGSGPVGRYYIDAQTGAVLTFVSDKHECGLVGCTTKTHAARLAAPPVNTTVTVMGWTNIGVDAYAALTNVPLPGLVLNVPGIGNVTTDANGQFTINIAAPVSITVGAFDGRHHNAISGSNAPGGNFTVNPGVNSTIQLLTSGATSLQTAHTNTTYWVDQANEWVRSIVGNSAQMNTADAIVPTVNINLNCNAYYTGNTINFYVAGSGCSNTANATVVVHEWGHGLDDRYGGISNTSYEGLSEGWGDILGMYLVDSPLLGSGFQTAGVPLRNGNNTRQYHTASQVHAAGESWMGFAWKLRDRLATTLGNRPTAIALTDDIVVGTIVADAVDQPAAVLEVFLADDNDGNLANGTPHAADLIWACDQHALPYPAVGSGPTNDECADAIMLSNGIAGPFTTVGATTSAPAWGCASGGNDVWFTYVVTSNGTLTVQTCGQATWDTALQLFSGSCGSLTTVACNDDACSLQSAISVAVTPGYYYLRVGGYNGATGSFSLDVNGPGGPVAAASTPYGVGCYSLSRSFYEYAANTGFDLANSAMRLTKVGNHYVASAAGSFVAPSGSATTLTLGDDATATVSLTGSFPYPGGSTSSLEVCSNGYVSVAAGNGTSYTPVAASWLTSVAARWGTWHDFNPGASGSGLIKFEQIGQVVYITWDGVYSYGTTSPNTWQLQFNLLNGNVTYAWGSMVASGNGWLIGYANGTVDTDLGSRDISATLPGGFATGDINAVPLVLATTLPVLGTTVTMTTSQWHPSSLIGLQILSLTKFDPGIDLAVIGMPNCYLYADLTVLYTLLPALGTSTYAMPVPSTPSLMGAHVMAQSTAFAAGLNAAGLVTSNGVDLTLGL
ncbi:MAG: hypothetical protein K8J09_13285 [Planctomycetes bacterium]|nr:hypothetical protein [Planctomycetota bacterium]